MTAKARRGGHARPRRLSLRRRPRDGAADAVQEGRGEGRASARRVAATATIRQGARAQAALVLAHRRAARREGQGLLDRRPPAVLAGRLGACRRTAARLHHQVADADLDPRLGRLVHRGGRLALARRQRRGRGRWDTWTATPTGIAQFHPGGAFDADPVHLGPGLGPGRAGHLRRSACTRSSTGSAAGRTTSGSTSTPARRAPRRPARATPTARTHDATRPGDRRGGLHRLQPRRRADRPRRPRGGAGRPLDRPVENLAGRSRRGATLHPADITDADAVAQAFAAARPTVVYHLAAQIDVRRAVADPGARRADQRPRDRDRARAVGRARASQRFVMASTGGAIYGDAAVIPTPESAPARPLSPYAVSKAAAEGYVEYYALRPRAVRVRRCGWPTSTARARTRAARRA